MQKLVLLRHGQSLWNRENRFTGWVDVDLTDKGVINSIAPLVRIVLIWQLFFFKILINSKDLYSAIPQQIINKIFLLRKFFILELKYYDR